MRKPMIMNITCEIIHPLTPFSFRIVDLIFAVQWSAIIVNGSCNCKFQIHVYDNQKNRNYIVEANRLSVSWSS
jgi:hypothetical protein